VYETRGAFDGVAGFDTGTSVLVSGNEPSVRASVLEALAAGGPAGDGLVVVTTDGPAVETVEDLSEYGSVERSRVGVVAVEDETDPPGGVAIEAVGSAGDLTGVSLATAKLIRGLGGEETGRIRLGLVSVSTLLMYAELQTVFQFLHVLGSRVSGGGWLGLFAIDPSRHDRRTVSTVRAAFDAELRLGDGLETRGAGVVTD
jgi:hypothetical protein